MDSGRERLLATLLGGFGTVFGIFIYQVVPDLGLLRELGLRLPNAVAFVSILFLVGAGGGYLGHRWFISWKTPSLMPKAISVGGAVGFAIAVLGWGLLYSLRGWVFPFAPFAGMQTLWFRWLPNALLAGPIGGMLAAMAVVSHLRRLEQASEPSSP